MIEPDKLETPPRVVRLTDGYLSERNGAIALLAMILIAATCMTWSYAEGQRHLIERGVEEQGRVVREWYTSGKGAGYHVEVTYPARPEWITKRFDVGPGLYRGEQMGDPVTVKMDPEEPTNAALYGLDDVAARDHIRYAYTGLAAAFLVTLVGFLLDNRDARRQRRILRDWPVGTLTVERWTPYQHRHIQTLVSGTVTDDRCLTRRARRLPCDTIPARGATLPIFCDPNSKRVATTVMLGKVEPVP